MNKFVFIVKGDMVDFEMCCMYYYMDKDIIVIKFYCCNIYYLCY